LFDIILKKTSIQRKGNCKDLA